MSTRAGFALLLILTSPALGVGQAGPPGAGPRYGITLGVGLAQTRDEVLAAVRHQGPSMAVGVFREAATGAAVWRVGASFAFASLTDRYSPDRSSMLFHPALELRYGRRVARLPDGATLFLGGGVGWSTRFAFFENWDMAHPYWLTSADVKLAGTVVRQLRGDGHLRLDLDVPVLAAISRPPERFEYKEVDAGLGWMLREIHRDLRVTSLHEHAAVRAALSYQAGRRGLLGQTFFWQAAFVSTRLPGSRPVTSVSHTVGFSHPF